MHESGNDMDQTTEWLLIGESGRFGALVGPGGVMYAFNSGLKGD